MAGMVSHVTG